MKGTLLLNRPALSFYIDADPCEYMADEMPREVADQLALIEEYREIIVTPINSNPSLSNDPKSAPKFWNLTITNLMDFPFDPS